MVTLKKLALTGLAALTFGGAVAISVSSADAQATRPYGFQRDYEMSDGGVVPDLAGAAIGTGAAIGGAALDTGAALSGGMLGFGYAAMPSSGSFGYHNWPYGNGYHGGGMGVEYPY